MQTPPAGRSIVVAIDGTGNNQFSRTDVSRRLELIDNQNRPFLATFYSDGVGVEHRYMEAAIGTGTDDRVQAAYLFLARHWRKGDRITLSVSAVGPTAPQKPKN